MATVAGLASCPGSAADLPWDGGTASDLTSAADRSSALADLRPPADTGLEADSHPADATRPPPDTSTVFAAVGKFCHDVVKDGKSVTYKLEIGTGSAQVTLSATSNNCNVPLGSDCTPIPTGTDVPWSLSRDGVVKDSATMLIQPGDELIFAFVAHAPGVAGFEVVKPKGASTCETVGIYW